MQEELISVIVPVYNAAKYFPRCLYSIESQTYSNLEIILVDDGSTDESGRLCDDFAAKDSRIKVIHQMNQGQGAARNAGQDASSGDYLFFPDADDYFHHDLLMLMYNAINQGKGHDLAIVREKQTYSETEDTSSIIEPKYKVMNQDDLLIGLLARGNDRFFPFMWNKLYRRSLIETLRTREYPRSEDFDFIFRAFLKTSNAILIDNDLYYWFQHPGSLTKDPSMPYWDVSCLVRICFRNYQDLPKDKHRYGSFLLQRLYRSMVFWKARSFSEEKRQEDSQECQSIEHVTRKTYMTDKRIPLLERYGNLLLIHCPRLTRLLMRITKNL